MSIAEPGYYSVFLKDYKVRAELTATERAGLHRYTFPQSEQAWLILDLSHGYQNVLTSTVYTAELEPNRSRHSRRWSRHAGLGKQPPLLLLLQVSRRPERIVFYSNDKDPSRWTTSTSKRTRGLEPESASCTFKTTR